MPVFIFLKKPSKSFYMLSRRLKPPEGFTVDRPAVSSWDLWGQWSILFCRKGYDYSVGASLMLNLYYRNSIQQNKEKPFIPKASMLDFSIQMLKIRCLHRNCSPKRL